MSRNCLRQRVYESNEQSDFIFFFFCRIKSLSSVCQCFLYLDWLLQCLARGQVSEIKSDFITHRWGDSYPPPKPPPKPLSDKSLDSYSTSVLTWSKVGPMFSHNKLGLWHRNQSSGSLDEWSEEIVDTSSLRYKFSYLRSYPGSVPHYVTFLSLSLSLTHSTPPHPASIPRNPTSCFIIFLIHSFGH